MAVTTTPRRRSLLQRFGLGRSSASFAIAANGATAQVAPPQSQDCESGTALMPGVRLFHDGSGRPPSVGAGNNGGTRVETAEFDGSYVSFVADLPPELASRIRPGSMPRPIPPSRFSFAGISATRRGARCSTT